MHVKDIVTQGYSEEELKNLSKEELIELFLELQDLAIDYYKMI